MAVASTATLPLPVCCKYATVAVYAPVCPAAALPPTFDVLRPIAFLRWFGLIFYQVLDIMSVTVLLITLDCRYFDVWPRSLQYYNQEFPAISESASLRVVGCSHLVGSCVHAAGGG